MAGTLDMIIKRAAATNFGSYANLVFDFNQPGLHLISGPTGSGKSTLCDLVPWALFGKTAKNGLTSEILAWNADDDTKASIELEVNHKRIRVLRQRGKQNDLYFAVADFTNIIRGKDLLDTQRLLNQELGVTADQYLTSAYYHELSNTAQFFSTTAKNRRQITEQLVDLTQVSKVQFKLAEAHKLAKNSLATLSQSRTSSELMLLTAGKTLSLSVARAQEWDINQGKKLTDLENKAFSFDTDKEAKLNKLRMDQLVWDEQNNANLARLRLSIESSSNQLIDARVVLDQILSKKAGIDYSKTCRVCNSKLESAALEDVMADYATAQMIEANIANKVRNIESSIGMQLTIPNPVDAKIETEKASTNPYLSRLRAAISEEINPHLGAVAEQTASEQALKAALDEVRSLVTELQNQIERLNTAIETAGIVRQALIETAIREVEQEANRLLSTHFDAIIRLEFVAEEFDNLDVNITKDGNTCSYTQLSKGQKQMLKLAFAVACMKCTANRSSIKFEQIFFDEALDGLSEELKVASFGLLEELSSDYTGVYVVEHSTELKALFTSAYSVSAINGTSQIEKTV